MHDDNDNDLSAYCLNPDNVLPKRLHYWAETTPDKTLFIEVCGRTVSYRGFYEELLRWCEFLRSLGIRRGDSIASFLPTSIDAHLLWLAASCIGALEVPVNRKLRGEYLHHILCDSDVRYCFVRKQDESLPESTGIANLQTIVVPRRESPAAKYPATPLEVFPLPHDISSVIYTSGTTGPAKGVVIQWSQVASFVGRIPRDWLAAGDVNYTPWPMFHLTGRSPAVVMADVGGSVVLREMFSAADFWRDIRTHGATLATIGAAMPMLMSAPPRDDDADNPLRIGLGGVAGPINFLFQQRFGTKVAMLYGSTEVGFPIRNLDLDATTCNFAGAIRPGYAARIVDESGADVGIGVKGELLVKPPHRALMMNSYLHQDELTQRAIVDGWYKTGDMFVQDENGNFRFIDRLKDTIRRFGENISATELEGKIVLEHDVGDCCVVGVPAEASGSEIVLAVAPAAGTDLDFEQLYLRLKERLPKFMLPSYIFAVDSFPRTPSGKIRKTEILAIFDRNTAWQSPTSNAARAARATMKLH